MGNIIALQELLSLMSALTNDNRFVDIYDEVKGKERVNMCTVLDEIEEKGIAKGREEGREEGKIEILYSLVHDGVIDAKEAAKRAGKTLKAFNAGLKKTYG